MKIFKNFEAAASRKLGLTLDATSPYIRMANKILEGFPVYIGWVGKSMGRGLFASRDIQRGELVLKEEPWYTSLIDDQDKIQTLYAECLAQVFYQNTTCHKEDMFAVRIMVF